MIDFRAGILPCLFYVFAQLGVNAVWAALPAIKDDESIQFTKEDTTTVISMGIVGVVMGKVVNGVLVDKIGGRVGLFSALGMLAAVTAGYGLSSSLWMFALLAAASQYMQSACWPSCCRIFRAHLRADQLNTAFSILGTFSRVGSFISKVLFGALLAAGMKWSTIVVSYSISMAVAATLAFLTLPGSPEDNVLGAEQDELGMVPGVISAESPTGKSEASGIELTCQSPRPDVRQRSRSRAGTAGDGVPSLEALDDTPELVQKPLSQKLRRIFAHTGFRFVAAAMGGLMCQSYVDTVAALVLSDELGISKSMASTLSGAFPLGMLLAVSMVARIYERLPGRSQARMIVGLILAAAVCCVLEAMVIMSQPFTPEGNGYLLGFLLLCHAACIGVPFYVPASVFSAKFGQEDTGLVVNMIDGFGYACSLVWSQVAGRVGNSAGWGVVLLMLAGIATFCAVMFHFFFKHAADIMFDDEEASGGSRPLEQQVEVDELELVEEENESLTEHQDGFDSHEWTDPDLSPIASPVTTKHSNMSD